MQPTPIGKDCNLYYDDPANWAAPDATEIADAVDVTQPGITKNMIALASRAAGGWNPQGAGLKTMDLQFGYLYNIGGADTVFNALRDAFLNDTVLAFYVLDGPIGGVSGRKVEGFRFPAIVSEFPVNQELEDGMRIEVKADYARYLNGSTLLVPDWYSVDALA